MLSLTSGVIALIAVRFAGTLGTRNHPSHLAWAQKTPWIDGHGAPLCPTQARTARMRAVYCQPATDVAFSRHGRLRRSSGGARDACHRERCEDCLLSAGSRRPDELMQRSLSRLRHRVSLSLCAGIAYQDFEVGYGPRAGNGSLCVKGLPSYSWPALARARKARTPA